MAPIRAAGRQLYQRFAMSSVGELSFDNELRMPELIEAEPDSDGVGAISNWP